MRRTIWAALFLVCAAAFVTLAAVPAPQGTGYHLLKKVTLGGEGGWDYLSADPVSHHVYLSRGTHIMVVDSDGKILGDIPNLNGTHGAQIVPDLGRGFSSNGRSNSVTIFDLNARSHDASAIDATTGEVAGTVPLTGKPEAAQTDGMGHAWVNIEDKAELIEFDTKELKVLGKFPLPNCEEPTGMDIDRAHKRLFIGCHSKVMLVASYDGKIVASVPIGEGVDASNFDPSTQLAFASCGDGTITVAHEDSPDKYTVVDTISTQRGARTMTLDTGNHNIYTVTSEFGPPPAATPENPRPRPTQVLGTFTLLIYGK